MITIKHIDTKAVIATLNDWSEFSDLAKSTVLENVMISDADLSFQGFDGVEMCGVYFLNCDLTKARFTNSKLFRVNFIQSDIRKADFTNSNIAWCWFNSSDATRTIFNKAHIEDSCFGGAVIEKAYFKETTFRAVDFGKAINPDFSNLGIPLVTVKGLDMPITIFNNELKVGFYYVSIDKWAKTSYSELMRISGRDKEFTDFWFDNKKWILQLAYQTYPKQDKCKKVKKYHTGLLSSL